MSTVEVKQSPNRAFDYLPAQPSSHSTSLEGEKKVHGETNLVCLNQVYIMIWGESLKSSRHDINLTLEKHLARICERCDEKRICSGVSLCKWIICARLFLADLARALKQTKIVSCALTPGPVQWKNTGKKFIRGTEELGSLEVFLMNKVWIRRFVF